MLILVIFCKHYRQFKHIKDTKFPYRSKLDNAMICIISDEDIDMIKGIERGFLYINYENSMSVNMKVYCKSRFANEITFVD